MKEELIKYTEWLNKWSITAQYEEFLPTEMVEHYIRSTKVVLSQADVSRSKKFNYCKGCDQYSICKEEQVCQKKKK